MKIVKRGEKRKKAKIREKRKQDTKLTENKGLEMREPCEICGKGRKEK